MEAAHALVMSWNLPFSRCQKRDCWKPATKHRSRNQNDVESKSTKVGITHLRFLKLESIPVNSHKTTRYWIHSNWKQRKNIFYSNGKEYINVQHIKRALRSHRLLSVIIGRLRNWQIRHSERHLEIYAHFCSGHFCVSSEIFNKWSVIKIELKIGTSFW